MTVDAFTSRTESWSQGVSLIRGSMWLFQVTEREVYTQSLQIP